MDGLEKLRQLEKEKILKEVNSIRSAISDLEQALDAARKRGKPKEIRTNVVHILPHIDETYKKMTSSEEFKELPFIEMVAHFKLWVSQLALTIAMNEDSLHHPAVMKHMESALDTCKIIDYATKNYFGE